MRRRCWVMVVRTGWCHVHPCSYLKQPLLFVVCIAIMPKGPWIWKTLSTVKLPTTGKTVFEHMFEIQSLNLFHKNPHLHNLLTHTSVVTWGGYLRQHLRQENNIFTTPAWFESFRCFWENIGMNFRRKRVKLISFYVSAADWCHKYCKHKMKPNIWDPKTPGV